MAYMSRLHSALGVSPFEMLHGCKPRLAVPIGVQLGLAEVFQDVDTAQEYLQGIQQAFELLDDRALQGIKKQFAANKRYWEKRRSDFSRKAAHNLAVGDLVLEVDERPDTALNSRVRGPYRVVSLEMDGALAVLETGQTQFKPGVRFRRHVSNLARFFDKHSL
jgi:hypothetical protein